MAMVGAMERVGGRVAPAPVRYASALMWLALALVAAGVVVLGADDVSSLYDSGGGDELGGVARALFPLAVAIGVLVAAFWAWLAVRVRRADSWARGFTWLLSAVVAALGLGFLLTPSAWGFVVATVAVLAAASALLAAPSANRFFHAAS